MTIQHRTPHPTGLRDAALLWSAPRSALHVRLLLPWSLVLGAGGALWNATAGVSWATAALWTLFPLSCLVAALWVAAHAVRDLRPGDRPTLREQATATARAVPCQLILQANHLGLVLLFAVIATLALLLERIPGVGSVLFYAWLFSVGLAGALLAAFLLITFPFFVLLALPASVIAPPTSITVFLTCWSYLRRRPLKVFLGLVSVIAATTLALVPVTALVFLATAIVRGVMIAVSGVPDVSQVLLEARVLLIDPVSQADLFGSSAGWACAACRLPLAAFVVASLLTGLSRLYLILRRDEDGVAVVGGRP